jgi:thiol-disulfide isomerase/thioredoxin
MTITLILIVCLFAGIGIYYALNRTETPSLPNSTVDIPSPNIQNVSVVNKTDTGATIEWTTDEPATSQVEYGETEDYGTTTTLDEELTTSHSVTLDGLEPNTPYYYTVISQDANGNKGTSEGKFTTLAKADETPPTISEVAASNITESSAIIGWTTDEPATSQVEYGTTEDYGTKTTLDEALTTSHSVKLSELDDGTTYYFKVISKDASGNEATSEQTFDTPAAVPVSPEVDSLAPDFTLQDLNGNDVTLSDFQGKIVLLNLWATWCEPCLEELPLIQAISDNWPDAELVVIAIAAKDHESLAMVEDYITENEYTLTVIYDSEGQAENLYDITTWPTTFFIDAEGIIKKIQIGSFSTQAEIEDILNSFQ